MKMGRISIIKKKTIVKSGRKQTTEEEFYNCWCEIQDLNSTEKYTALQTKLEETIVFKVRTCKKVEEVRYRLKEFFVKYKENEFEIYAATPMYKERGKMLLKCNRIS